MIDKRAGASGEIIPSPKSCGLVALGLLLVFGCNLTVFAAGFTGGDILVSRESGINEYTISGAMVQSILFPTSPGDQYARDLVVSGDGRLQLYDGTFHPYLCTLDPNSGVWTYRTMAGWSTVNQVGWGHLGAFQNYVFATDMSTSGAEAQGIIRFDLSSGTAQRFASDIRCTELTVGQNGLVYAAGGPSIEVFDPSTLGLIGTIRPNVPFGQLAVGAAGDIYTASGDTVSHFSPDGVLLNSLQINALPGGGLLTDIDLSPTGQLLIGSWLGGVYLTDVSLDNYVTLPVGSAAFVAFATQVPEPGLGLLAVGAIALVFNSISRQRKR